MALDLAFQADLRQTIKRVRMNEYMRVAQNLQYQRFTKMLPSTTLRQRFITLLESAVIQDYGQDGGGVRFEDQVQAQVVFTNHVFKGGWKESEYRFKDFDHGGVAGGEGVQLLSEWTRNITSRAAYQPQLLAVAALRNGEATSMVIDGHRHKLVCFDLLPLFSKAHPYNYKRLALGTFSNLFSGAPSVSELGFRPLGGPFAKNAGTGEWEYSAGANVSAEDAFDNLWEVVTYIAGIKQADGITPRYLEPTTIVCGKRLAKMLSIILESKFISMHSGSGSAGGGSVDIEGSIKKLGFKDPVILAELTGLGTREEWDWYLECEENSAASEIGVINVGINEPWRQQIYTASSGSDGVNYELAVEDAVVSIGKMRAFVGVGVPQHIFKSKAPR